MLSIQDEQPSKWEVANFLKEANSENSDNVPTLPYGIGCFGAGDAISAADEFIRSWHTANDTSR